MVIGHTIYDHLLWTIIGNRLLVKIWSACSIRIYVHNGYHIYCHDFDELSGYRLFSLDIVTNQLSNIGIIRVSSRSVKFCKFLGTYFIGIWQYRIWCMNSVSFVVPYFSHDLIVPFGPIWSSISYFHSIILISSVSVCSPQCIFGGSLYTLCTVDLIQVLTCLSRSRSVFVVFRGNVINKFQSSCTMKIDLLRNRSHRYHMNWTSHFEILWLVVSIDQYTGSIQIVISIISDILRISSSIWSVSICCLSTCKWWEAFIIIVMMGCYEYHWVLVNIARASGPK